MTGKENQTTASQDSEIKIAIGAALPAEGYCKLESIIGSKRKKPPVYGVLPMSRSAWFAGRKAGKFPMPVHGQYYRVEDVRALLERIERASSDS